MTAKGLPNVAVREGRLDEAKYLTSTINDASYDVLVYFKDEFRYRCSPDGTQGT